VSITACNSVVGRRAVGIDPEVVVALGALQQPAGLLGTTVKVMRDRGKLMPWPPRGPLDESSTPGRLRDGDDPIHGGAPCRRPRSGLRRSAADLKVAADALA